MSEWREISEPPEAALKELSFEEMDELMEAAMRDADSRRPSRWRVKPIFAWYDFWVGLFWDRAKRRLYIFPVPCFGIVIKRERQNAFTGEWY